MFDNAAVHWIPFMSLRFVNPQRLLVVTRSPIRQHLAATPIPSALHRWHVHCTIRV